MAQEKITIELEDLTLLLAYLEWVACELPDHIIISAPIRTNMRGYKIRWNLQAMEDKPSPEVERGLQISKAFLYALTYHDRTQE